MPCYVCGTCGVQYAEAKNPPSACIICEDERQFVGWEGQQWTTLEELRSSHRNQIVEMETGLTRIGMEPGFAIGQHAYLIERAGGNILWDCITLIDDDTIEALNRLGGVSAIAVSHPHYYSAIVDWSRALGDIPVYLHAADRKWVTRQDDCLVFWEGENHSLGEGLTLIHGGGHFEGGAMLHWVEGARGRGVLMAGDIIQVVHDRRYVSFMYSYPNYIPLAREQVERLVEAIEPFAFDRIYSPWPRRVVATDAKAAVRRSAERYIRAINNEPSST